MKVSDDENDVLNGKEIKCFRGDLDLGNLTNEKDLILPEVITGDLYYLNDLTTLKGVTLPECCDEFYYKGEFYSLEEIKKIQKKEENK